MQTKLQSRQYSRCTPADQDAVRRFLETSARYLNLDPDSARRSYAVLRAACICGS